MIDRIRTLSRTVVTLAAVTLFGAPAFADTISLTLASPNQTAVAGSTVSFSGMASVSGNSSPVYLDDFLAVPQPLTGSDDGFYNATANPFNSGDSINTLLFTVTLPSSLSAGIYNGSFKVYEDNDPSVFNTQNFSVTVASAAATPEPSSWLLLATGLAIGGSAFALKGKRSSLLTT